MTQFFLIQPITCILATLILIFSITGFYNKYFFYRMILKPYHIVREHTFYELITADLVHINLQHLIVNEASLIFICGKMEQHLRKTSTFGSIRFALIYLASLLTGNCIAMYRNKNDPEYSSAGASGSIMGCLFGFMYLEPHTVAFYMPVIGPLTNEVYAIVYAILMFIMKKRIAKSGANYGVHFWGAVGGMVMTILVGVSFK